MELTRAGADLLGEVEAATLLALARLTSGTSGRELARLSGMSTHSSTRRALQRLVEIGLVATQDTPNAILYSLNRDHVLWPPVFDILTSPAIVEERMAEIVREVAGEGVTVALFGSVARGDAHAWSDIDLALVFPDDAEAAIREHVVDQIQERVTRLTGNQVQAVAISRSVFVQMVRSNDPLIASWSNDALTISGPDLSELLDLAS